MDHDGEMRHYLEYLELLLGHACRLESDACPACQTLEKVLGLARLQIFSTVIYPASRVCVQRPANKLDSIGSDLVLSNARTLPLRDLPHVRIRRQQSCETVAPANRLAKVARILVVHMAAQKPKPMVHRRLDRTLLKRLEDFRIRYHLVSRAEAARWLLEAELDLQLSPKNE